MSYDGLRDWLAQVDAMVELGTLEGVDWNLEIGAVVDVLYRKHPPIHRRWFSTRYELPTIQSRERRLTAARDLAAHAHVLQYDIVSGFQWRRQVGFAKHLAQIYFRGPAHL